MQLIFNVDDFGHSKGVNLGIIEVRSATLMAGMPGFLARDISCKREFWPKDRRSFNFDSGEKRRGIYKATTNSDGDFLKQGDCQGIFLLKI